jgi:hypothetical protein
MTMLCKDVFQRNGIVLSNACASIYLRKSATLVFQVFNLRNLGTDKVEKRLNLATYLYVRTTLLQPCD